MSTALTNKAFSIVVLGQCVYLQEQHSGFDSSRQIVDEILAPLLALLPWPVFKWCGSGSSILDRYDFLIDQHNHLTVYHSYQPYYCERAIGLSSRQTPAERRKQIFKEYNRLSIDSCGKPFDELTTYLVDSSITDASSVNRNDTITSLRDDWYMYGLQTTVKMAWLAEKTGPLIQLAFKGGDSASAETMNLVTRLCTTLPWKTDATVYAESDLNSYVSISRGVYFGDTSSKNTIALEVNESGHLSIADTNNEYEFYASDGVPFKYSYRNGRWHTANHN